MNKKEDTKILHGFLKIHSHSSFLTLILLLNLSVVSMASDENCKKHIELHSAKFYASQLGMTEMSVLSSYKINLWQKETNKGKGKNVGKLIPGSRAVILAKGHEDYKVRSPLDKSEGWINKMHVSHTLYQDINTREACNK